MAKTKQQKQETIKALEDSLKTAKGAVFANFQGLTVEQIQELRRNCRAEDIDVLVAKLENNKEQILRSIMQNDETVRTLHEFLGYAVIDYPSIKEIYNPIRDVMLLKCLNERVDFNIVEKIRWREGRSRKCQQSHFFPSKR